MEKRPQAIADHRAVATWICIGVAMLVVQVMLGGITRLTGSGLSITEWNIATGAMPPFNQRQWLTEFDKYRQTPQFRFINSDFTLSDFKFIFFWEWFHRLWARLVGVVFIIGFVYLLIRKKFRPEMIRPLLILFLLGALQGAVGWIMVKSGLTGDAIYVQPTKLAMHFIFALGLIGYTMWFALELLTPRGQIVRNNRLRLFTLFILLLLVLQLLFGALMAGYKAASAAPTWPTINGEWIPDALLKSKLSLVSLIDNKVIIHFVHRMLAYLLFVFVVLWSVAASSRSRMSSLFSRVKNLPLLVVLVQVVLGICTVLAGAQIVPGKWVLFDWLALAHQLTGMVFFLVMIAMLFFVRGKDPSAL